MHSSGVQTAEPPKLVSSSQRFSLVGRGGTLHMQGGIQPRPSSQPGGLRRKSSHEAPYCPDPTRLLVLFIALVLFFVFLVFPRRILSPSFTHCQ